MNRIKHIFKHTFHKVERIYQKVEVRIFALLEERGLTKKQIDDLALKMDVIGASIVAQLFVFPSKSNVLGFVACLLSLIFCGIIWSITFIMKGYDDE
mgnify:CR=1 FL=1